MKSALTLIIAVFVFSILALTPFAAAKIVVNLTTPNGNNQSSISIAFNFTANNDSVMNIINTTLWGNFSGKWRAVVSNTTTVAAGIGYVFNLTGIPEGVYVWNVKVTGRDGTTNTYNFSASNRTLIIDRTKPQLQSNATNYVALDNFTLSTVIYNSFANSTNTKIVSVRVTYMNHTNNQIAVFNGTLERGSIWNVAVNLSGALISKGSVNLTVNITDLAGNSEVVNNTYTIIAGAVPAAQSSSLVSGIGLIVLLGLVIAGYSVLKK